MGCGCSSRDHNRSAGMPALPDDDFTTQLHNLTNTTYDRFNPDSADSGESRRAARAKKVFALRPRSPPRPSKEAAAAMWAERGEHIQRAVARMVANPRPNPLQRPATAAGSYNNSLQNPLLVVATDASFASAAPAQSHPSTPQITDDDPRSNVATPPAMWQPGRPTPRHRSPPVEAPRAYSGYHLDIDGFGPTLVSRSVSPAAASREAGRVLSTTDSLDDALATPRHRQQ